VPPLRFETFALLAAQGGDELAQSYERNAPFAGKLENVEFGKDWAPIYLSAALVDTELGALLNITDQILKSWSSAGDTEYVHFNYPKPATFPFGGTALSEVVRKKTGSLSILFNWNTNGSAVVVRTPGQSIIAVTEATSLPVTYGADGKPKSAGGADLLAYEEEGYDYFADIRDPNLARVVQYTAMYQLFRAIASEHNVDKSMPSPQGRQPQGGNAILIEESLRLTRSLSSNGNEQLEKSDPLREWFFAFRRRNPDLTDEALANMAVDRQSSAAFRFFEVLKAKQQALQRDVDAYNAVIKTASASISSPDPAEISQIMATKAAIENRKNELDAQMTDFTEFAEKFSELAQRENLGPIRERFLKASEREPAGAIRTPSSVLSWNKRHEFTATGGHNLRAKTLRLERLAEGTGVELVEGPDGAMILRYGPAHSAKIESHARELARAVEHGGEREVPALMKLVGQPVTKRARSEALALTSQQAPAIGSQKGFGALGSRVYGDKKPFVDDLRQMAAGNRCCVFVARDGQQTAYVTEVNLKPPPAATAYEAKDTVSLLAQLKLVSKREGKDGQRAVIFLDSPDSHVEALVKTLKGEDQSLKDLMDIGEIINRESVAGQARATVFQADLSGKPSLLRSFADAAKLKGSQLLEKIGLTHPPVVWKTARVEKFDGESLDAILKSADWQTARDGIPRAIKVTFAEGTQSPPSLAVVAGFNDKAVERGAAVIERASNGSLGKAGNQGASVAQYLMSVRNELGALPPEQLRRLVLVVDERGAAALFTLLNQSQRAANAG